MPNNADAKIARNYAYNTFYEVLLLSLPLITTPYISRILGATNVGIYNYTISILSYFVLFGRIGMDLYGTRTIAYYQHDEAAYSKAFYEMAALQAGTVGISIAAYCLLLLTGVEYRTYYWILLMALAASALDFTWLFRGIERFDVIVVRNAVIRAICVCAIFLFVKSPDDLGIYTLIYAVSIVGSNVLLGIAIHRYVKKSCITTRGVLAHFPQAFRLFIPRVAISVYVLLDKSMIKWLTGNVTEVAYYSQGEKIIKLLLTVVTSLGIVMMPRVANAYAQQDHAAVKSYAVNSVSYVLLLAVPMMFGIAGVAENFVPLFFGGGYEKVTPVIYILSPIILFIGLTSVLGTQYLIPVKRERSYTISVLAGALSNVCLNWLLIAKLSAFGAALATVSSEFIVLLVQMYAVRGELPCRILLKPMLRYLLGGAIMMCCVWGTGKVMRAAPALALLTQIGVGITAYAVYLLLIRDEVALAGVHKLLRKGSGGKENY